MTMKDDSYVVDGISSLSVEGGDLVIRDGIPRGVRERIIPKIERTLKRIIIPSRHGSITWDAMAWLKDVGISLYVLRDGKLIATSSYSHDDASLLRAQARAIDTNVGVEITRYLLSHKLIGQALTASMLSEDIATWISEKLPMVDKFDIKQCGLLEGAVANKYWESWRSLEIQWIGRVKPHWQGFTGRHSPLAGTDSPHYAATPANALLNYAYGVLEGESTLACHVLGLDPLLGISHTDNRHRPSMALDLMEPGRPVVDALLLDWIRSRTFKADEFTESKTGIVRIKPALHRHVAAIVKDSVTEYQHHWEWVAHRLVESAVGNLSKIRTPLTRTNNKKWRVQA